MLLSPQTSRPPFLVPMAASVKAAPQATMEMGACSGKGSFFGLHMTSVLYCGRISRGVTAHGQAGCMVPHQASGEWHTGGLGSGVQWCPRWASP